MVGTHGWDESLELGQDELDREHHLQFGLAGSAADAIEQGRPAMARRLIEQLAGYSAAHFSSEELLMENAAYGQLEPHRLEHRSLLAHIDEVRQLLVGGEHELALPMALDLMSSFASHIAAADREFLHQGKLDLHGKIPDPPDPAT